MAENLSNSPPQNSNVHPRRWKNTKQDKKYPYTDTLQLNCRKPRKSDYLGRNKKKIKNKKKEPQ